MVKLLDVSTHTSILHLRHPMKLSPLYFFLLASDEESFVCDICHKHFSSREKLEDHELLHEDVKQRALDTHDQDQVGFVRSNYLQRC